MFRARGLAAISIAICLTCSPSLVAAASKARPLAMGGAPGAAQEEAVFLVRQGADIVSAEWHRRTASAASGTIVVNELSPISYVQALGASCMRTCICMHVYTLTCNSL